MTFVHRRLWPALLAIALAREPWQTHGLSHDARALLKRVEKAGELQTSGEAARELARRLLVHTREIHTEAGSHAKIAERWDGWSRRVAMKPLVDIRAARRTIEEAVAAFAADAARMPALPWAATRRR